jgi:ferric-dicitrate binding protein FerR (iron transport regulator)
VVLYSVTEQYIEALVQKYADGTATPEEVQQLMDWYHTAPVMEVSWPTASAQERGQVYHRMLQRLQGTLPAKRRRLYRLTPLHAAAAVLLIVLGTALFYNWPAAPVSYSTISNPSGQIKQVQLPDGSTVWLNAATTLRYANSFSQHRQLQLDGEAYFKVTHDFGHPFTVESGGVHIRVLGTRFNVSSYAAASRTVVSLLEGKVSVMAAEKELAILQPATQLEWNWTTKKATIKTIDTTAVVAWKAGRLQFQGQPLGEIVQTLERWYGVHIRFANPDLEQCRYYLNFDGAMPLKDLLTLLSEVTNMHYAVDKQTVVISGKGCQ